jgi:hypothetical protein
MEVHKFGKSKSTPTIPATLAALNMKIGGFQDEIRQMCFIPLTPQEAQGLAT